MTSQEISFPETSGVIQCLASTDVPQQSKTRDYITAQPPRSAMIIIVIIIMMQISSAKFVANDKKKTVVVLVVNRMYSDPVY